MTMTVNLILTQDHSSEEDSNGAGKGKGKINAHAAVNNFGYIYMLNVCALLLMRTCSFSTLEHVGAVTLVHANMYGTPTVVNFNETFDAATILRLRKIELFEPAGYLKNLATANPEDYALGKIIASKAGDALQHGRGTHFFVVGTVCHSALTGAGSHQICVAVSDRTFPRALAVLGNILGKRVLFVPTYRDGVSFGTFRSAKKESGSPVKQGLKSFASTSGNGVLIGPLAPST